MATIRRQFLIYIYPPLLHSINFLYLDYHMLVQRNFRRDISPYPDPFIQIIYFYIKDYIFLYTTSMSAGILILLNSIWFLLSVIETTVSIICNCLCLWDLCVFISLMLINHLKVKLNYELNLENTGILTDFIEHLTVTESKLNEAYSSWYGYR